MLASSTHAALADQYLDRLAFGWQRRNRAVQSHVLDFAELRVLDQSLQACRQGLTQTVPASLDVVQRRLDEPLSQGELFAVSLHAINIQDVKTHATCIGLAQAVDSSRDIYNYALAWSSSTNVAWALEQWVQIFEANRAIKVAPDTSWLLDSVKLSAYKNHPGLMATQNHRAWLADTVRNCLHRNDDGLNTAACAMLQLALSGNEPLSMKAASALMPSSVAKIRCLAAQAVLWLPKPQRTTLLLQQAADTLLAFITDTAPGGNAQAEQAVWALACWRFADFADVLKILENQPAHLEVYLQALGWSGSVQAVPVLMTYLDHPTHARLAGASLSMLTGSLPARDGWQAAPLDTPQVTTVHHAEKENFTDAIPPAKLYADLPPPDATGFSGWWNTNRHNFNASTTWLAGLPESQASLTKVLEHGKLAWRHTAARRICASSGGPSLDTTAPAHRQRQWLTNPAHTLT